MENCIKVRKKCYQRKELVRKKVSFNFNKTNMILLKILFALFDVRLFDRFNQDYNFAVSRRFSINEKHRVARGLDRGELQRSKRELHELLT